MAYRLDGKSTPIPALPRAIPRSLPAESSATTGGPRRRHGGGYAGRVVNMRLLLVALEREPDIVLIRKRTRRIAELLGFDRQDQTRVTTAISELARNALEYAGGGHAEFRIRDDAPTGALEILIRDTGPGIAHLDAVLSGTQPSEKGMGVGL